MTHPKYVVWIASIVFVGFYAMAQPSITQVLTWFHSLIYQWNWELFLSDPLIFIFWWFIIITVFIWGRGLFCGWLCPYGVADRDCCTRSPARSGPQALPVPAAASRWHDQLQVGEVRDLRRACWRCRSISMGLAEKHGRGRAVQDHVPGRRVEPHLAVRPVLGRAVRRCRSSSSGRSASTSARSARGWRCPRTFRWSAA